MLTLATIQAAQDNDINAVGTIIAELEPMITQLADRLGNSSTRDDLAQAGRIALWEAIGRFSGGDVDNFRAFMYRTIECAMREQAREESTRGAGGVKRDDIKIFHAMVKRTIDENGVKDLDLAEELAQTVPQKGRRLSATRARAARLAYEGAVSVDYAITESGATLEDLLTSPYGVPGEETEEDRTESQRLKERTVRAVIRSMGRKQAAVLRARWGIEAPCLGSGAEADEILAAELDTTPASVRVLRNQAHKAFATRYSRVTGMTPCTCTRCDAYRKSEGVSL